MVNAFIRTIGGKWLTSQFRAAAEGLLGPLPQRVVLFGRGHMTEVSFLLGCILVPILLATGNEAAAAWVAMLAGAGVSVGLVRKNWREDVPPEVLTSRWYGWLKSHAGDVAGVFGVASLAVQTCEPSTVDLLSRLHLTCNGASLILICVAAVWTHLGLSAAARLAPPPFKVRSIEGGWPPVTRALPPPPPPPSATSVTR